MVEENNSGKNHENNLAKKVTSIASTGINIFGKILKGTIYTAIVVGSYAVGEFYQPAHKLIKFEEFYNRCVEDNSPKDYENYTVISAVNKNSRIETYFGNKQTNSFHRVKSDGTLDTIVVSLDQKTLQPFWRMKK